MQSGRSCSAVLAAVLAVASCSSDGDSAVVDVPVGDASAFRLGWPAARAALQDDLGDTNNEWEIRGNVEVARLTLDEADARVPAALRSDWTSATRFQDTVITLLGIADYNPERLPKPLTDAAFGEGGGRLQLLFPTAASPGSMLGHSMSVETSASCGLDSIEHLGGSVRGLATHTRASRARDRRTRRRSAVQSPCSHRENEQHLDLVPQTPSQVAFPLSRLPMPREHVDRPGIR